MKTAHSLVPIGEVASYVERPERPVPGRKYRQAGVRLWGEGAYERESIDGADTKYSSFYRLEADDIVVNKIWARSGSVAVVPKELAGAYVSSEFPTLKSDEKLLPSWFHWFTKTEFLWRQCQEESYGTSGKNRIRPERFLEIKIPLPSPEEQRRIIARIEELAAKIKEACRLRREAIEKAETIYDATLNEIWADSSDWKRQPVSELITFVSGQVDPTIEPYASLPHINGESIESGTGRLLEYQTAREDGMKSGKYHFPPDTILYSKIRPYLRKAVEVPFEGICSADIYAFESIDPVLEPRFLMYSLLSPDFTAYAKTKSGRTRIPKLNRKQVKAYRLAYPPRRDEQQRIVKRLDALLEKLNALRRQQRAISDELDALLPSVLDKAFSGAL